MRYGKPELQRIDNEAVFSLARELFSRGKSVKFVVSGDSMYPFIRNDRDKVTLSEASFDKIKKADIVLAYREKQRAYILHRVVKKTKDGFYMVGDAQTYLDGPYPPSALVGVVTEAFRVGPDGREKRVSGRFYNFLARVWICAIPFRPFIFKLHVLFRRITNG